MAKVAHINPPGKLVLAAAVLVAVSLLVTLSLFIPIPGVSAQGGDDASAPVKPTLAYPNLSTHLNHLAEGYNSGQMSQGQAAGEAPVHSGGSVAVTIHLDGHVSDVVTWLEDNGGDPRNVGVDYIEAYVPVSLLGPLSLQPGVTQVQEIIPPQPAYGNVTSQAVALHLADSWQDAGYQGQGIKVGVIDVGFTGYSGLRGIELPSTVVARCYTDVGVYTANLADCEASEPLPDFNQCERGDSGSVHGTAVAEAVIDIAPDATLYISQPVSWGDLQATVAWMASEGVTIINHSVGWTYNGPGDGTSPFSSSPLNTVDRAVDRGITWVNAAGNSAGDTWLGSFSDHDGDGRMSFNSSGAEINTIDLRECRIYAFQLRWDDDWGGADTDLDIYLWDKSADRVLNLPPGWGLVGSIDPQSGASDDYPFEFFFLRAPFDRSDVGVVIVHDSGPVPDWVQLELWSGPGGLEYSNDGSITNPAESANPGLLAVGAAPFYDVNTIEFFSSQGPTPDGRIKPDIVGIDCAASVSYERFIRRSNGQECWFPGTSQASPHVAGMAALVRQRFPDLTAEQVAAYLKDNAEPRGAVPNNTWGYGLARLPASGVGECVHDLTTDGTFNGAWAAGCQSQVMERGYSQYYQFTLEEDAQVTIELTSGVDPYLFLRAGEARSGDFLHENDDIEAGANLNSRITATLTAGTYTIEATTYDTGRSGEFTLTISGLGGGAGEEETTPDGCGFTLTADGATTGAWASDCQSQQRSMSYARYYTFTLAQESAVTIELTSDVDTYLYLRPGVARSGDALHENDDIASGGVNLNSRIGVTLAAGTYTIEATTYGGDQSGTFTLTFTGLDGNGEDEMETEPGNEETDNCATTAITTDGTTTGAWASDCQSQQRSMSYARYYTFTLDQESAITIELTSDVDTYLYLRSGDARSGDALHENDDIASGGVNLNSRIGVTLAAGTYTIEATTYGGDQSGTFTLTFTGLDGDGEDEMETEPGNEGTDNCAATAITTDGATTGAWASDCQSQQRSMSYARYYTFTLDQESAITIELTSDVDTYLYLRPGDARSGDALHENDDIASGGVNLNSRIGVTLAAGTYTIEATTYAAGSTGAFTLTISGLGGGTDDGDETETDQCGSTISADGSVGGSWAADCQSQVSGRGYARYYTFTLEEASQVTIELVSSVDPYLYLRQGEARSGDAEHENDDIESGGVNLNSRISETLEARTYTIEATTYNPTTAGSFTLTISGLD